MHRTLTVSAVSTFAACPRRYQLAYSRRWKPRSFSGALSVGRAVHSGLEALHLGRGRDVALEWIVRSVREDLSRSKDPDGCEEKAQLVVAQARAMVRAYCDRWYVTGEDVELSFEAAEVLLQEQLRREDGRAARGWRWAGKVDAIATSRATGLPYLYELKTTSADVHDLAASVAGSLQVHAYLAMASRAWPRREFFGAIVDVVKKPTIRRGADESLDTFEARAQAALCSDPERFFARVRVPYDSARVADAEAQFVVAADAIAAAEKKSAYLAARGPACSSVYGGACAYRGLCWHDDSEGYYVSTHAHEELGLER